MIQIKLNEEVSFDLEKLIETRLIVQANSGGGKSWLIRRLLEQSYGKVQQIMIDLEGEFSSLREKYDYVVAGKDEDTPVTVQSAKLLASKIMELGFSVIIDLSELPAHEKPRYVRFFCEGLMAARPKGRNDYENCLVVIDEAHHFIPQNGQCEASAAVIDLATRGRKRKFCTILATQRLSKLHKDAAAEMNNKLIGRTGLDIDMKRASEELGFTKKEQSWSLRMLASGEFYAFGPAISQEVIKVKIGDVHTSHSVSRTKTGFKTPAPRDKIKKVLEKLSDLPKEAEAEAVTISDFKNQIRTLKGEITTLKRGQPVTDPKEMEKVVDRAFKMKDYEFDSERKAWQMQIRAVQKAVNILAAIALPEISKKATPSEKFLSLEVTTNPGVPMGIGVVKSKNTEEVLILDGTKVYRNPNLKRPEQKILNAVVWLESLGVSQPARAAVCFVAGYTMGSGGFNNPCGKLRTNGLIDYQGGGIVSTESGRVLAKLDDAPTSNEDLHRRVMDILDGPKKKILQILIDAYPEDMSKQELAEKSQYTFGSGGFNNPLGRLRTISLIDYPSPGRVKASPLLFPL